jgi:hypothetical protein
VCEDLAIDTARIVDYATVLDRWSQFAWSACGDVTP